MRPPNARAPGTGLSSGGAASVLGSVGLAGGGDGFDATIAGGGCSACDGTTVSAPSLGLTSCSAASAACATGGSESGGNAATATGLSGTVKAGTTASATAAATPAWDGTPRSAPLSALAIGAPTTPVMITAVVIASLGDHVRKRQCLIHSNTAHRFIFLCIVEFREHLESNSTMNAR